MSLLRAKKLDYSYIMLDYLYSVKNETEFYLLYMTMDISPERIAEGIFCYRTRGGYTIFV